MCQQPAQEIKSFETEQAAWDWMIDEELKGEINIDNERFAYIDDEPAQAKFLQQSSDGCCGNFEADVLINGRKAWIGCNYDH